MLYDIINPILSISKLYFIGPGTKFLKISKFGPQNHGSDFPA